MERPIPQGNELSKGLFLVVIITFLTGHSVARYVCLLAPLTHSAALCFTKLALLARSVHKLAHSLHSLPRGTVGIYKYVFTL